MTRGGNWGGSGTELDLLSTFCMGGGGTHRCGQSPTRTQGGQGEWRTVPILAHLSDTSLYSIPAWPLTHSSDSDLAEKEARTSGTQWACLTGRLLP